MIQNPVFQPLLAKRKMSLWLLSCRRYPLHASRSPKGRRVGTLVSVAVPVVSTALILRGSAKFSSPMDSYTEIAHKRACGKLLQNSYFPIPCSKITCIAIQ